MSGKKQAVWFALLLFFLSSLPLHAVAATQTVQAVIPPFPVTINGQKIDHPHSMYPFLFYNDITYLPMTWNNLRALGIQSDWTPQEGLSVWSNTSTRFPSDPIVKPLEQDLTDRPHASGAYSAKVASIPIRIQNTVIGNAKEPYPFLQFRDVTYMPLTWRFVHELLQIDIAWSESDGLQLIGGQNGIGNILGDDADFLYIASRLHSDPAKSLIKLQKSTGQIEWLGQEAFGTYYTDHSDRKPPLSGEPVSLDRQGNDLYYEGLKVYTLTEQDLWEAADIGGADHTYTRFKAGENAVLISVNLRWPFPVIGPNFGDTHLFLIREGTVTELKDLPRRPDRVIPNPDGTVWIACLQLPGRSVMIPGTALLALLSPDGSVRMVNEAFQEADIEALGLANPSLPSPAYPDGSLYVTMQGMKNDGTWGKQDTAGLYRLNTRLEADRLTESLAGSCYLDGNGDIYIQGRNNLLTNWSTGVSWRWFDHELARTE